MEQHGYADDKPLYILPKQDGRFQECAKEIIYWLLNSFIILNSDKTDLIHLGLQSARYKVSEYVVAYHIWQHKKTLVW